MPLFAAVSREAARVAGGSAICRNSVIVQSDGPLYKLAPRAGGSFLDGKKMRSDKMRPDSKKNGHQAHPAQAHAAHANATQTDKNYRPTDKEPFMGERQREYFRMRLLAWRDDILKEAKETLAHLQAESENHPDLADRASSETDRAIELRARDRQRKLIAKIEAALARLDDGTYGYCEETGEPISLKRLEARPIATLSVEAQERHERRERIYRDE